MSERKYNQLSPSLQAHVHYQALLARIPESTPLERVTNNDPALFHTEASSYLPTSTPIDLAAPPPMFGTGAKDSTFPMFKPNPLSIPPTLHQLSSLLRAINVPTAECVTANDYAQFLATHLRKHFDLSAPLSSAPPLTAGGLAAKRKLMQALDDDGGSLELARELIKRLRVTIAEQQSTIDELYVVKIGLKVIVEETVRLRKALSEIRSAVRYQHLDSQDLVLKCGDAFKEISGIDVFSSKVQLAGNAANGGLASAPGLSVVAQEQLKLEMEKAGVVGGDPFKDRLTTCVYALNTMKRFMTVSLQRTPIDPNDVPADAARFDWENDDSMEAKRFKRKFPSVQNLARRMGVSFVAQKDRPAEGLPSFMEPLANYNTPSQELALVKAVVATAREVTVAVQLISVLAEKAGVSSMERTTMSRNLSGSGDMMAGSGGGGAEQPLALRIRRGSVDKDAAESEMETASRLVSLEGDLRTSQSKLAAAEARIAKLESESNHKGGRGGATNPTPTPRGLPAAAASKRLNSTPLGGNKPPLRSSPAPSSPPPIAVKQRQSTIPTTTNRLSRTQLELGEPVKISGKATVEPPLSTPTERASSASLRAVSTTVATKKEAVPEVKDSGVQTSDEDVLSSPITKEVANSELDTLRDTNESLDQALISKTRKVEELESELTILRGRLSVFMDSNSSFSPQRSFTEDLSASAPSPARSLSLKLFADVADEGSEGGNALGYEPPAVLKKRPTTGSIKSGNDSASSYTSKRDYEPPAAVPHKRSFLQSQPSAILGDELPPVPLPQQGLSITTFDMAPPIGGPAALPPFHAKMQPLTNSDKKTTRSQSTVSVDGSEAPPPPPRRASSPPDADNVESVESALYSWEQPVVPNSDSMLRGDGHGNASPLLDGTAYSPHTLHTGGSSSMGLPAVLSNPDASSSTPHHTRPNTASVEDVVLNTFRAEEDDASSNTHRPPTTIIPPSATTTRVAPPAAGNTVLPRIGGLPPPLPPRPGSRSITPAHIAEVRQRSLAGKKSNLLLSSPPSRIGTPGSNAAFVDRFRNALSSPLPVFPPPEQGPLSPTPQVTPNNGNSPPYQLGQNSPDFTSSLLSARTASSGPMMPDNSAARAAAVEQIRRQLMFMNAGSPGRPDTSPSTGRSAMPVASRQVVFAPAQPMVLPPNPDNLRRL